MEKTTELSALDRVKAKYAEGGSDIEVATLLGLTRAEFYKLIDESPDFAKLVEKGRAVAEAWWYSQGRLALRAEKFNTALYNFTMKNRYGWADKVEQGDKSSEGPTNLDQAMAELQKAMKRIAKTNPEWLSGANLTTPTSLEENADD